MDGLDGAWHQRKVHLVALPNLLDNLARDAGRGRVHAELGGEIAGPFRCAHAHQTLLAIRLPPTTMVGHIPSPDLLPNRLGVDQNPVQVEDRRCHHALILLPG
jgi:hypothetical protein